MGLLGNGGLLSRDSSAGGVTPVVATGVLDGTGLYGHPLVDAANYEILGAPYFNGPAAETELARVSGVDDDHIWIQAGDGGAESAGLTIKFAYIEA